MVHKLYATLHYGDWRQDMGADVETMRALVIVTWAMVSALVPGVWAILELVSLYASSAYDPPTVCKFLVWVPLVCFVVLVISFIYSSN